MLALRAAGLKADTAHVCKLSNASRINLTPAEAILQSVGKIKLKNCFCTELRLFNFVSLAIKSF